MKKHLIKPKRLRPGDTAAIVSLSGGMLGDPQFRHLYHIARERMERDYGLTVLTMPNALRGSEYLYRHPQARAQDLMEAFLNPEVKAVFSAIGGDDTIRLLPYIDFSVLAEHPKIFTGFSDTTVNHFMMYKAGLVSYYGLSVMNNWAEYTGINSYTAKALRETLFEPCPSMDIPCCSFCGYDTDKVWWDEANTDQPTPRHPSEGYEVLQGSGKVTGELLGGCMDLFPQLVGTSLWPALEDWRGKLLLLETSEWNMPPDLFAWILRGLQAQGILDVISGMIVGRPAFRDKEEPYKKLLLQVVGFEAGRHQLPILYQTNVGHAYPTGIFPLGLTYEIDCNRPGLRLLEPATEV